MFNKLKKWREKENYLTSPFGMIVSPIYISRRGLYKSILKFASNIHGNVLDFGCGSKPYESLFSNSKSYIGVDIEVSGHRHIDSKVDVFYDGKKLPFPDKSFDSLVAFEVFEHIFNLDEVLTEITRILKHNGQMLISIPFAWPEHEVPYDNARYTSYGIKFILEKNGFEILEIYKSTTYFLATCQLMISYLAWNVFPVGGIPSRILQILIIFPLNIISVLLNYLLPKNYEYFSNSIILCRNKSV